MIEKEITSIGVSKRRSMGGVYGDMVYLFIIYYLFIYLFNKFIYLHTYTPTTQTHTLYTYYIHNTIGE